MSTLLVAAIIIALAVIPASIFIHLHKRREKQCREALFAHFKKAGAKHGLSFAHQQMLKDKMLGLDTYNQVLLVFAFDAAHTETVVDLADMEACTMYKEYHHIAISDSKDAKTEQVLTQMGLKVAFSNNNPSLPITFYNNHVNVIYEISELEKKAKEWEGLIAQKTSRKVEQRA